MSITERGHFIISNKVTERGRTISNSLTEQGLFVLSLTQQTPSYYLSMDGVDDKLERGSLNIDTIEMDILVDPMAVDSSYFDINYEWARRYSNDSDDFSGNWTSAYVNDVLGAKNTNFIPTNERVSVKWVGSSITGTYKAFVNGGGTGLFMKGRIYSIKLSLGGVLKAHYDMTLGDQLANGTIKDETGNGNHATLTGGTWLVQAPSIVTLTVDRYKISDETGISTAIATITFDRDIVEFIVKVLGTSHNTGTTAHSYVGNVPAGIAVTAEIDWTELYQEGDNRINIYGKDTNGNWTLYE